MTLTHDSTSTLDACGRVRASATTRRAYTHVENAEPSIPPPEALCGITHLIASPARGANRVHPTMIP